MSQSIPFGDKQREVLIAADVTPGVGSVETILAITATESMWIDASRLIIHAAPDYAAAGTAPTGIQQPWDLTPYCRLTSAIYKNAIFLLRGDDPDAPGGAFGYARDPRVRYPGFGPLYLESEETLELAVLYDLANAAANPVASNLYAMVPCVPDRIRGQGLLQKTIGGQVWDESLGSEYLAGDDTVLAAAGDTQLAIPFVDAGVFDIGGTLFQSNTDALAGVDVTQLNYVTGMDQLLVPGGGERLILDGDVPLVAFSDHGRQQRWCRLGYWGGNRGQSVQMTVQNRLDGVTAGRISVGGPYLPRGMRHPSLDACGCK